MNSRWIVITDQSTSVGKMGRYRGRRRIRWAELEMWRSLALLVAGRLWFVGVGLISLAAVLAVLWILDGVL